LITSSFLGLTQSQVFVNEIGNENAAAAVAAAAKSVGNVDVVTVQGARADAKGILTNICTSYGDMLKNAKPPHLIFDATKGSESSETVKAFASSMWLPTLSTSYGQDGDIAQWKSLNESKKNFLLHVNPPADILAQVVRSIATTWNMTTAAILYDNSFFFMDHKREGLLKRHMATKHIITAIASSAPERGEQIKKLRESGMKNFLVLGTKESIREVLRELIVC